MIHFEKKEKYLLVFSEGERKGLHSLQDGAKKIFEIIYETNSRLVLVDYRKVHFNVSNTDTFNSIRFYEAKLPSLNDIVVAVVLNNENQAIGRVWKDIGRARGFNFDVFSSIDEAENWLLAQ